MADLVLNASKGVGKTSLFLTTPAVIRAPDSRQQVAYAGALAAAQLRRNAEVAQAAAGLELPSVIERLLRNMPSLSGLPELPDGFVIAKWSTAILAIVGVIVMAESHPLLTASVTFSVLLLAAARYLQQR